MPSKEKQTHGLPALLSFFWPGLGQLVKGQVGKGIAIMVGGVVIGIIPLVLILLFATTFAPSTEVLAGLVTLFIVWLVGLFAFFIWNVIDAYNSPN